MKLIPKQSTATDTNIEIKLIPNTGSDKIARAIMHVIIPSIRGATQPPLFSFFMLIAKTISEIALNKNPNPAKSQTIFSANAGFTKSARPAQRARKPSIRCKTQSLIFFLSAMLIKTLEAPENIKNIPVTVVIALRAEIGTAKKFPAASRAIMPNIK